MNVHVNDEKIATAARMRMIIKKYHSGLNAIDDADVRKINSAPYCIFYNETVPGAACLRIMKIL